MNYFIALILPPLAVFLARSGLQVALSLLLFVLAILALAGANSGAFMGGYAAGPVLYVLSVIHAFVFTHRFYQQRSGSNHPHRDQ